MPDIRQYVFDVVGLGFCGVAAYIGVTRGVGGGDFAAFVALAGAYLGMNGPAVVSAVRARVAKP